MTWGKNSFCFLLVTWFWFQNNMFRSKMKLRDLKSKLVFSKPSVCLIHMGLRNILCDIIWRISLSNQSCWLERKGHVRQSILYWCIWQLSPFQILCNFGSSILGKVPEFYSRHAFWSFCFNRCVFWNESPFLIWVFLGAIWLNFFLYIVWRLLFGEPLD